ncbi:Armadillo repeat-containing protein 4 [Clonorchis sinensis]|uniref:Armadillo repeat-containing protein 4 n=1 Tax=Clonorchis sinensis TaxID=79923 RepID=A0A8T1MPM1_CLOSI|nr:Armadillo repeat-containing protein 4 [Clonorchis sinensis]
MGSTLSRAAEWTSARGGSSGKLTSSPINNDILEEAVYFLKNYQTMNPGAQNLVFKSALKWKTSLLPQDMKGFTTADDGAISTSTDMEGEPLAALRPVNSGGHEIYVRSLQECVKVINTAGSRALAEVRACLESNPDPLVNMLGDRFSSSAISADDSIFGLMEEIISNTKDCEEAKEKKISLKLALDLHNFDMKLMNDALQKVSKEVRQSPGAVEHEIEVLEKVLPTGKPDSILDYIRPTGVFTMIHENGCRAPPWRQMHGDIAYFEVGIRNPRSELSVTASTYGWFLNGGYNQKTGQMNFDRVGEVYRRLVDLLQANSSSFSEFMKNVNLTNLAEHSSKSNSPEPMVQKTSRSGSQKEDSKLSQSQTKAENVEKAKKRPMNELPVITQPSQRWQTVGLRPTHVPKKAVTEACGDQTAVRSAQSSVRRKGRNRSSAKENLSIVNQDSSAHSDNEWPIVDSNNSTEIQNKRRSVGKRRTMDSNVANSDQPAEETEKKESEEIPEVSPTKEVSFEKIGGLRATSTDVVESMTEPSLVQHHTAQPKPRYTDVITLERLKGQSVQKHVSSGHEDSNNDVSSESETEEEDDVPEHPGESHVDLPSEYWQIGKIVKYLKGGNQTSTIISLCALHDMPLNTEVCQLAVRDVGGLDVLINLLETEEVRCKLGSLKILREITKNPKIRRAIADVGGLQPLVNLLRSPNRDLKCLSAEVIANVANFHRARRTVRQYGGIKRLVALLDCSSLNTIPMTTDVERDIEVARCGALALWSCSKSRKNKLAMKKAGVISLLARLLKSPHENMLIPVVGTLQECASEPTYRVAIRTEGMIEDLVKNLKRPNPELQMHCASTIFKCAEEPETRDLVRLYGGLEPLIVLLTKQDNKELLAAATGAIWKCAISKENVVQFQKLGVIEKLVGLLNEQPEEMSTYLYVESVSPRIQLVLRTEKVLVNVVGALGEMAKDANNIVTIRKTHGIPPLVSLLTRTNQDLLINTTRAIEKCAGEPESMSIIESLDGVRLLWSLLKNPNPEVQSGAAWAICPCIENAKDAGEMVRSFVGGLELIVSLLRSNNMDVLAAVCAAVSKIAVDEENLAVITDHGVVALLSRLTCTKDDKLRCPLTEAIARCCTWGTNRVDFGRAGAVSPLVGYLNSTDPNVHRSTAKALFQLSRDPNNCVTMHDAGVVKPLLQMVGSPDMELQTAAAGCISNIRRLSLANEKAQLTRMHAQKQDKKAREQKSGVKRKTKIVEPKRSTTPTDRPDEAQKPPESPQSLQHNSSMEVPNEDEGRQVSNEKAAEEVESETTAN